MPVKEHTNRLINEKSPYLLQHAHNPVDWYPWGEEAFQKAKAEDKPVFLSIGYSACHWCHVMEEESFEDDEVARLLNEGFVSIKVDREERPDVDHFYMEACVALTGSGGWPLSCFLTPERTPFFAGTYFPKEDSLYGTGFITLLNNVEQTWKNRRDEVVGASVSIVKHMSGTKQAAPVKNAARLAFEALGRSFDKKNGGFGSAPKFPTLQNILFLLEYYTAFGEPVALEYAQATLSAMHAGGIYDHVGGGFFRYSTDARWLVPHFEKMMTDNALHILVYAQAGALPGGRRDYLETARDVAEYCLREMLSPQGGFYTSTDADSEGEEGKYYLFTPQEASQVLGPTDGPRYCGLYGITDEGNFEGKNIPNFIGKTLDEEEKRFARGANEKLREYRAGRVPSLRDEKQTALVNGLMTAALAQLGRAMKEQRYIEAARRCAEFIEQSLFESGRLQSGWNGGVSDIPAVSDVYACVAWGMLELYEATLEPPYLAQAIMLSERMNDLFWDSSAGGYFIAGVDAADLPVRVKNIQDGAMPCGNSVAAMNLLRLARICDKPWLEKMARNTLEAMSPVMSRVPVACCGAIGALLYMEHGGREVVLANGEGFEALRSCLPAYAPFTVFSACGAGYEQMQTLAPPTKENKPVNGKAAAYFCENGSCRPPVTEPEELLSLLSPQR